MGATGYKIKAIRVMKELRSPLVHLTSSQESYEQGKLALRKFLAEFMLLLRMELEV